MSSFWQKLKKWEYLEPVWKKYVKTIEPAETAEPAKEAQPAAPEEEVQPAAGGIEKRWDETYQQYYFFNSSTGVSGWTREEAEAGTTTEGATAAPSAEDEVAISAALRQRMDAAVRRSSGVVDTRIGRSDSGMGFIGKAAPSAGGSAREGKWKSATTAFDNQDGDPGYFDPTFTKTLHGIPPEARSRGNSMANRVLTVLRHARHS